MTITTPETQEDFDQIYELNYSTFVEEIPQHEYQKDRKLVDKFHHKNKYMVAKKEDRIVGMICYNGIRPFSLDQKLADLDSFLPPDSKTVEVRLLAVCKSERNGTVMYRLVKHLTKHLDSLGFNVAIISGTTRKLGMYKKMGFVPFGPLVGNGDAQFQPMYVTHQEIKKDLISE